MPHPRLQKRVHIRGSVAPLLWSRCRRKVIQRVNLYEFFLENHENGDHRRDKGLNRKYDGALEVFLRLFLLYLKYELPVICGQELDNEGDVPDRCHGSQILHILLISLALVGGPHMLEVDGYLVAIEYNKHDKDQDTLEDAICFQYDP